MVGTVLSRTALLGADVPWTALATPESTTSSFFNTFFGQSAEDELGLDLRALPGAVLHEVLPRSCAPAASPNSSMKFQLVCIRIGMKARCRLAGLSQTLVVWMGLDVCSV